MNPPDIHEFSDLIRQRLEELTNEDQLGVGAQKVVELDQQSVGRLSRMDALQSQAMAQANSAVAMGKDWLCAKLYGVTKRAN